MLLSKDDIWDEAEQINAADPPLSFTAAGLHLYREAGEEDEMVQAAAATLHVDADTQNVLLYATPDDGLWAIIGMTPACARELARGLVEMADRHERWRALDEYLGAPLTPAEKAILDAPLPPELDM